MTSVSSNRPTQGEFTRAEVSIWRRTLFSRRVSCMMSLANLGVELQ